MTEQPFDRALRQAALMLKPSYSGEDGRLGRGLEMALHQAIAFYSTMEGKDAARIPSATDAAVLYHVVGTHCDCPDQAAPGQRCTHRYAVALTRIAQALTDLHDHEENPV